MNDGAAAVVVAGSELAAERPNRPHSRPRPLCLSGPGDRGNGRLILGLGAGWYEKDYSVYGYDYGTVTSRMDLLEHSLARIEQRLTLLVPRPVRKIPILIGGTGVRRTLPIVAEYADIWHTFATVQEYRRKNAVLEDLVAEAGRDENEIERGVHWTGRDNAEAFLGEGVTLFTTEIHPTDDGYDFSEFQDMIAWRDQNR